MTAQVVTVAFESCEPVYVAPGGWLRREACAVDSADIDAEAARRRCAALGAVVRITSPPDLENAT